MTKVINEIFLKDYSEPDFWTNSVELCFEILSDKTVVTSILKLSKNINTTGRILDLNGVDLKLVSLAMDDTALAEEAYTLTKDMLSLTAPSNEFKLKVVVEIDPENNLSCEGLYKSGNIFCTQNEPEGFRKITYYQDRPDVMASFRTKVIGDKTKFPFLLANGNKVGSGENLDGTHFCTWEDPHKKPSYLFALVAGNLALVSNSFTTKSGREVALEIFVDKGNEDKCTHAMDSLKDSMRWDEEVFGLEYDLDIYMIVAVDSFNMGAMENKGLNIFNSAYVLAKKETATDANFQGIQAVIGHEYFHNWTGNRVTCRDWFQLTLKEGLTVFRDQEFSSDMLSRSVKRIEDVKGLRLHQFAEDAGPLSHPIQPKSYIEMNNFYTATVYEKGAEVIRMIHTLLGKDNFRKGMDLYFERHDGCAVTTQDFIYAMRDASEIDLEQFKAWYDQSGTPKLNIETTYDAEEQSYIIDIEQISNMNESSELALHMPFHYALYDENGKYFDIPNQGKIELKELKTSIKVLNVATKPIPSWNTNFSAPVIINYTYTDSDLFTLMSFDLDDFNRYDACQRLYTLQLDKLIIQLKAKQEMSIDDSFFTSFKNLLLDNELDSAFKAYALNFVTLKEYNYGLEKFELENSSKALNFILNKLGLEFQNEFLTLVNNLQSKGDFSLSHEAMGRRSLRNTCLSYLVASKTSTAIDLAYNIYVNATNMTEEHESFNLLVYSDNPYREKVIQSFYDKWKTETLVMQKWLQSQALASDSTLATIKSLESTDIYDQTIPNILRSLIGSFGMYNICALNNVDGSGYRFFADQIIAVDKFNPQIAAGLAKRLNHLDRLDHTRSSLLKDQLKRVLETKHLSNDTFEIVKLNLG
jgi:aminopeptidase N